MEKTLHKFGEVWEVIKNGKKIYAVQFYNKISYYDTLDKAQDMADIAIDAVYNNSVFNF